jgi:5-methylcytosine-specific restriction endonuclease McrA
VKAPPRSKRAKKPAKKSGAVRKLAREIAKAKLAKVKQPTKKSRAKLLPVVDFSSARLTVELVPRTSWCANVRSHVSSSQWDAIRRRVYAAAGHLCEVCGGRGSRYPVDCHEVWHYDDASKTQTLVRMIALCPACHECKHIGRAHAIGRGVFARAHLAKVNGWTELEVKAYLLALRAVWLRRSKHAWTLNLEALRAYGVDVARMLEGQTHRTR